MPENDEKTNNGLVTLDEDTNQPICPKCGEVVENFTHLGEQNYIKCPNGCRIGTTKISDDLFSEFVDQIDVKSNDDKMPSKMSFVPKSRPFPGIKTDEEILIDVLSTYDVSKKAQANLLQRLEQSGQLLTEQIVNVLTIFKECTKDVAPFIASEYELALRNRDKEKDKLLDITEHQDPRHTIPQQQANPLADAIELMKAMKEIGVMGGGQQAVYNPEMEQLKNQITTLQSQLSEAKDQALLNEIGHLKNQMESLVNGDKWTRDHFRLQSQALDKIATLMEKGKIGKGQVGKVIGNMKKEIENPGVLPIEEKPEMDESNAYTSDDLVAKLTEEDNVENYDIHDPRNNENYEPPEPEVEE